MAGLHVLTHVDIVICSHGAWVDLISGLKKTNIKAHNNHVLTKSELIGARIIGCTNKPPCLRVASVKSGTSKDFHGKHPDDPCLVTSLAALSNAGAPVTWASPGSAQGMRALFKMVEGFRTDVYGDTHDPPLPTTGAGFNLDSPQYKSLMKKYGVKIDDLLKHFDRKTGVGDGDLSALDPGVADKILDDQISEARNKALAVFPNLADMTPERQGALTDLAFNFGHIPKSIIDPIQKGDFTAASKSLQEHNPKWFHAGESNGRAMRVQAWLIGGGLLAAPE